MTTAFALASAAEARARQSLGTSEAAIYRMVAEALPDAGDNAVLVDVGCGSGQLWSVVHERFGRYIGIDAIRYPGFPADADLHLADFDLGKTSLPAECADVVASVETIEHLENPRAFIRELVRLAKPGGLVLVTTPNQLSLLSLITLVFKQRFSAFQDVHYPAHLTALLEIDLKRIAAECGLVDVHVNYSLQGRLVLTPWHYPRWLAQVSPRRLSDNLMLSGRKALPVR